MLSTKKTANHHRNAVPEASTRLICPLNAVELRQLWGLIEETQSSILLGFNDSDLIQELIGKLESKDLINASEINTMRNYLHSRILLIRDFAHSRTQPA